MVRAANSDRSYLRRLVYFGSTVSQSTLPGPFDPVKYRLVCFATRAATGRYPSLALVMW